MDAPGSVAAGAPLSVPPRAVASAARQAYRRSAGYWWGGVMNLRWCAIVTVCFFFADYCAKAADFQTRANQNGGVDLITVVGDLYAGDERTFINVALGSSNAVVVFQSRGGNLLAGIEIGKAIHLKGFSTLVPGDVQCASACALAWLGGRTRYMGNAARVGFHAVYTEEGGRPNISSAGNALVGAYLNQLGLPASAVVYITDTSPDKIQWLTFSDAQRYGIDVKPFDTTATTEPQSRSPTNALPSELIFGRATPSPDKYAAVAICFSHGLFGSQPCNPWSSGVGSGLSEAEAEKEARASCQRYIVRSNDVLPVTHECRIVQSVKNSCLALAAGGGFASTLWSAISSADLASAEQNALSQCQQNALYDCQVVHSTCVSRN